MNSTKTHRTSWIAAAAAVSLLLASGPARGQTPEATSPASAAQSATNDMLVPDTAEQHREKAEMYKAKAAGYRQDADEHRKMLASYKRRMAPTPKTGENPWLKKMRVHCEKFIADADALAREADKFAEYHTLRAAEMNGQ